MSNLAPQDVIDSAGIPDVPGAYVLGCHDTRITLYSQQVRALELAHALGKAGYISNSSHIAVIGGGAGGMTMAAALALQGARSVQLFERSNDLMPLQRQSTRRRLDPHIYNWPAAGAETEEAELPILDWTSGSAKDVRKALLAQYAEIETAVGKRLMTKTGHQVTSIISDGATFTITSQRDVETGSGREPVRQTVDLVVLAIGFGLEPDKPVTGIPAQTYWLDSGVPDGNVEGRPRLSVMVSGNGDGGLIDLIAAASRDFEHDTLIRMITRRPGIDRLYGPLAAVDRLAKDAASRGLGFDFIAAYDEKVGDLADGLGLTEEIAQGLQRGIQVYLQTRKPELLSTTTATLNRLAVYLVRRACLNGARETFTHVVAQEVKQFELPAPAVGTEPPPLDPEASTWALDCDGKRYDVDRLVVRRGPDLNRVRAPFSDMLASYPEWHEAWVKRFPEAAIAPVLSEEARRYFNACASTHDLQLSRHHGAVAPAGAMRRIKLALHDGAARWSGDVALDEAADVWSSRATSITILPVPQQLPALAHAVSRLALHAPACTMQVDIARWRQFLGELTTASRHAEEIDMPALAPVAASSELAAKTLPVQTMADRLNRAMDRQCLRIIDEHVSGLLERGSDPSYFAGLTPAPDVAEAMLACWNAWKLGFEGQPDLLARYLRLLVCATDSAQMACEAQTLVGPRKKKLLIRATTAALAVAAGWAGTTPHPDEPGNLARSAEAQNAKGAQNRTGHVCAAERVDGQELSMMAAGLLWRTDFVLLPMVSSPVAVAFRAEEPFTMVDDEEGDFTGRGATPSLMLTVDPGFKAAVKASLADVAQWLQRAEAAHRAAFSGRIETSPVENAGDAGGAGGREDVLGISDVGDKGDTGAREVIT